MIGMMMGFAMPQGWTDDDVNASGGGSAKATVTSQSDSSDHAAIGGGATVTKTDDSITIRGISSAVAVVDTQRVTGSASGTLRIQWGSGDRDNTRGSQNNTSSRSIFSQLQSPRTPPGAPEPEGQALFGIGLLVFGFGLIRYRKII